MSPRESLALLCDTFESDIRWHLATGYVLDTAEYFFAWRVVGLDWPLERMLDPSQSDPDGTCAFVWACAGDWRAAVEAALAVTPWVEWAAYERRNIPRLVSIGSILMDRPTQNGGGRF